MVAGGVEEVEAGVCDVAGDLEDGVCCWVEACHLRGVEVSWVISLRG